MTAVDVRNPGQHPAHEISFEFSSSRIWPNSETPAPMKKGIARLGPGQNLRFRGESFAKIWEDPATPATFDVRVEYTHGRLQERLSHVWPLDFEAYRDSMSVMTDERQERRDALEELKKIHESAARIARCFEDSVKKLVGANGLDLSVYTLRNMQRILTGGSIEKLPPYWFTASGFQSGLSVPVQVAVALEGLFRSERPVNRQEISALRGMTAEILNRFEQTFELLDH